ncbi:transcription-repair coupling factor [Desulfococcus multivorans]|uniref:Transcription-repair-coupling factor n=1 Tax=Desulfococcus multivorans DSM 2059 TaxID=1121405 RepID=S7UTC9_DESML|nr:transcription-repair coupling factor [Desulfococcus multivorans]AOY58016.1 Mfd: transcription-repair-coupling factor [Desulfococcus multivorans]AQV00380.1 transcription-repair coupling factor [Desulfococcus multivorans]EPR37279.1 transcription-repair coupling factor [Desulfococcus multivorans DSM 2059]SJZ70334.1 transcription-repair coupling factor [Desulfococcus multivorans DSM 2059]
MLMKQNQEKISIDTIISRIGKNTAAECAGLPAPCKAYLIGRIFREKPVPITVVLPSARDAERFIEDFSFFFGDTDQNLLYFAPYNLSPFKFVAYHNSTTAERLRTLYRQTVDRLPHIMVTTIDALQRRLIPKSALTDFAELIMVGEELDRDQLTAKLIAGGYTQTAVVEEPGDFCVRGGIIDIFSPTYPEPVRIEMFGDLVESLRFFSSTNQRTRHAVEEVVILPAKEAILKPDKINDIIAGIRKQANRLNIPAGRTRELIDNIKTKGHFPGIEGLLPLVYPRLDTLFEYIPPDTLFVLAEPAELRTAAEEALTQAAESFAAANADNRICVAPRELYLEWADIRERLAGRRRLDLRLLPLTASSGSDMAARYHFSISDTTFFREKLVRTRESEQPFSPLPDWIGEQRKNDLTTVFVCDNKARASRLTALLAPYGIAPTSLEAFPETRKVKGGVYLLKGRLSSGFTWPSEAFSVVAEKDIFGPSAPRRKTPPRKVRTELLSLEELKTGDLVVHSEHGIGRYQGLKKLTLNRMANDFLEILYKDDDKLYLPVDRMNAIQKYMGIDGIEPILDKMGGNSWNAVKSNVKKSVEKIAGDLLNIYAERSVNKGFAFNLATVDLAEFEAGFPFDETPDQTRAIEDVLDDMRRETAMDRLICGDVGYGKTEVALRAAYVAVFNQKQVAILVPTTVLAEQHFETFSQRFQNYPINIACLSRFRSMKEQRTIVEGVAAGSVDIVIGTHRLLQKDIAFRDLGLIILDEEQRFGVKHKERLKSFRSTVDVLALTATPIPRTLHMSLTGIRDISVISTPPEQRRPIITYISELEDSIIRDAVRKELKRKGQIFFVHNNIQTIDRMADRLRKIVPEARLDIAHGRMGEDLLEKVMLRFLYQEIDMLICTTIIESGLDVPAANTILVNHADRLGLAQIYQLRGRVGRGEEQAFAYLFIPEESSLSKDAQKRLKVLMEHSDLGSGFQIAMSDLKIRGGGTILGASQSGHIAAVGYDMFLKLMEDAVAELKGEPISTPLEPEINIPMSFFISEGYIPDIDQRLNTYRRLSKMSTLKEISDFRTELIDRFGSMPDETGNLLLKMMLKILATKAGVKRLDFLENALSIHFSEAHQKNPFGIVDLITERSDRFTFTPDQILKVKLSGHSIGSRLTQTKNILKEITRRVNG